MNDVTVDRVALRVHGDMPAAHRLAQLVAEGLAGPLTLVAADTPIDCLRVEIAAAPGEPVDALAGRIATRIAAAALESGR